MKAKETLLVHTACLAVIKNIAHLSHGRYFATG